MFPSRLNKLAIKAKIDTGKIKEAYLFAEKAHKNQKRKSGHPYIEHPVWIAEELCELGAGESVIIAALLHDTVEDTSVTQKQVEDKFGREVSDLVEGLTKFSKLRYRGNLKERAIDSFFRMILTSTKDLRVIFIKLVDRLHNMMTIKYLPEEKQRRIAKETIETFVPLANLLGVWKIMLPLEDYCFEILHPKEYETITNFFDRKNIDRKKTLDISIKILEKKLIEKKLQGKVHKFMRRRYSILEKSKKYKTDPRNIALFKGIEVVMDTTDQCYQVFGVIHHQWIPRFNKIKDYIARPKMNGYSALHTSVILKDGLICDFRILSKRMKAMSKLGLLYSVEKKKSFLEIINEILILQENSNNKTNFYEKLRTDILQKRIYVMTSNGDVIALSKKSCPIDVAYKMKKREGKHCYKAKVNGIEVHLNYMLKEGDVVEIVFNKAMKPKLEWLKWVKSSKAKKEIKKYLMNTGEDQSYKTGRKDFEKNLYRFTGEKLRSKSIKLKFDKSFLKHFESKNIRDFLINIGQEKFTPKMILLEMFSEKNLLFSDVSLRYPEKDNIYRLRLNIEGYDRVGVLNEVIKMIASFDVNILENSSSVNYEGVFVSQFVVEVKSFNQLFDLCDSLEEINSINRVYKS